MALINKWNVPGHEIHDYIFLLYIPSSCPTNLEERDKYNFIAWSQNYYENIYVL